MKEYFAHDYYATEGLFKIKTNLGHEGLGVYWELIEYLHRNPIKQKIDDIKDLAYCFHTDIKILKQIIEDFGLFEIKNNMFWSERVLRNLQKREEISNKRRLAGQKGGLASAKQVLSKKAAKCSKEKKIKENNKKKVDKKNNLKNLTPSEIAKEFFKKDSQLKELVIDHLLKSKSMPRGEIIKEVNSFINYWTEMTRDGSKQRWQTEKTFEVKRRLVTWFNNCSKFNKKPNLYNDLKI